MQCNAMQCNAMQCNAMQSMQCNAMQCNAIQYNAMQCNIVQYNIYIYILNNLQNEEFKKSVMLDINQQHETSITITHFNILDTLKSIKCRKSSGVDGISAEHFVFAHNRFSFVIIVIFCIYYTLLPARYVYENRHCPNY